MSTTPDQSMEAVERALDILAEYFENIQVFANRYDAETGTTSFKSLGRGNSFARRAQIAHWMLKEETLDQDEVLHEDDDEE